MLVVTPAGTELWEISGQMIGEKFRLLVTCPAMWGRGNAGNTSAPRASQLDLTFIR